MGNLEKGLISLGQWATLVTLPTDLPTEIVDRISGRGGGPVPNELETLWLASWFGRCAGNIGERPGSQAWPARWRTMLGKGAMTGAVSAMRRLPK